MEIEVRPADSIIEAADFAALDAKIFLPSDCFDDLEIWKSYHVFWIVADGQIVGLIALGLNVQFGGAWDIDKSAPGCLYCASMGIIPEFQHRGIGKFVKKWEIDYARSHGFTRMSTNCRASNQASLRLNLRFGFEVAGEVLHYYEDPDESTIVMELDL